jgi:carbon-monoxide dehydrogenase medium subunit
MLAGGQSLIPALNMRLAEPRLLVDINGLDALGAIHRTGSGIRIGALARHVSVAASIDIGDVCPLLHEAVPHIAHAAVRNRGSIGGSIGHADPAAELPACILALDGRLQIASAHGERSLLAKDFFRGLFTTALAPEEMILAVDVPLAHPSRRFAFEEIARRRGDYALVGIAAAANIISGRMSETRLACFGVADTPILAARTALICEGRALDDDLLHETQEAIVTEIEPRGDASCSSATRSHLLRVLLVRVLKRLKVERGHEPAA